MELASHNFVTIVPKLWKLTTSLASRILSKPTVQQFILSEDYSFDLVVVFAFFQEYSVALGHKYGAPVMNLGVSMLWPSTSKWIGEPSTFSYVLDQRTGATDQMSFVERLKNTVIGAFQLILEDYSYLPAIKENVDKYFRYRGHESRPPIEDMLRNVSLTLVNAHLSVGVSRPYLPGTVEIAGLHVNEPKPLTGVSCIYNVKIRTNTVFHVRGWEIIQRVQLPPYVGSSNTPRRFKNGKTICLPSYINSIMYSGRITP